MTGCATIPRSTTVNSGEWVFISWLIGFVIVIIVAAAAAIIETGGMP